MTLHQDTANRNPRWEAAKAAAEAPEPPKPVAPAQTRMSEAAATAIAFMMLFDPAGWWNLVVLDPEQKAPLVGKTFAPGSWELIAAFIDSWNGKRNLYLTINEPLPHSRDDKLNENEIANIRALYVDVDPEKGIPFESARRDLDRDAQRVQSGPMPPSVTVDSGGGNQMFWLLAEKVAAHDGGKDRARMEGRALHNIYGGDKVHSIEHIMRLPGTVNIPTPAKREAGRIERPAKILFQNDRRYTLEEFERELARPAPEGASGTETDEEIDLESARAVTCFEDLDPGLRDRFQKACAGSKRLAGLWDGEHQYLGDDKSGSGWRMCLARELGRAAAVEFTAQDYTELVHAWPMVSNAHDLALRQYKRDWGRGAEPTIKERGSFHEEVTDTGGDETPCERPLITIRQGELASIATEAEAALVSAGAELYTRGGAIVRPVIEDLPAARGRTATVPRTVKVSKESLTDHLARVADWQKFDLRSKKMVRADPTKQIAEIILSRDGEWRLPKLAGVITTPTLRPDLSMLSEPGYDVATGLLLCRPPKMPDIPLKPSRTQAQEALSLLQSLLRGFTFVSEADKSVALSMLMTPVVRGAMACAPLHAVRAPTPGSGKSYLTDIAAAISTGQPCPVITPHPEEKELEKRLGAALLYGQSLVSIDNLNGALSGDALCQMVERPLVQVRPLGVSELVRIENKHTVFATGNNLHLVGDIVRRTVVCTIDTGLERPETRQFNDKPFDAVLADRGKYVAAVLTIVLAYKEAGFPGHRRDLASFDEWSKIVRSPLIWLGCADPVTTTETARAEDPVLSTLGAVMNTWCDSIGTDVPLSAGDLKACAELPAHPELHAAFVTVAGDRSNIDTRRLGHWLSKYKGRIVGGLKFDAQDDTHAKQKVWVLKSAGKAGKCGYVSNLTWETVSLEDANSKTHDSSIEGSENVPALTRLTRKDNLFEPIGVFS